MKSILVWCASIAIATVMVISAIPKATTVFAAAGDLTGGAWSANIGWIGMGNDGASYGVKVATTGTTRNLSGYAWSPNIGWVNFNNTDCPPGYSTPCQPRVEWGANGGPSVLVKGFVRACSVFASGCSGGLKPDTGVRGGWDGFISLGDSKPNDPIAYGVKLNTTTGQATGFGWGSEVVGWVDFTGVRFDVTGINDPTVCPNGTPIPFGGTIADCPGGGGGNPTVCPSGSVDPVTGLCSNNTPPVICSDGVTIAPDGDLNQCPDGGDGLCKNIKNGIELNLIRGGLLADESGNIQFPYRRDAQGRCSCMAGYIMNPVTFVCTKPVYTEQ